MLFFINCFDGGIKISLIVCGNDISLVGSANTMQRLVIKINPSLDVSLAYTLEPQTWNMSLAGPLWNFSAKQNSLCPSSWGQEICALYAITFKKKNQTLEKLTLKEH